MHLTHHRLVLLGARDREHPRVQGADLGLLDPQAARYDDAAVGFQRLADGLQGLGLGAVDEPAGIHHHHVGAGIVRADLVSVRAQLRQDAL